MTSIALLLTEDMHPIPDTIRISQEWGDIAIVVDNDFLIAGTHVALEGEPEEFKKWLRPLKTVWVGKGSPVMQEFELKEVK